MSPEGKRILAEIQRHQAKKVTTVREIGLRANSIHELERQLIERGEHPTGHHGHFNDPGHHQRRG